MQVGARAANGPSPISPAHIEFFAFFLAQNNLISCALVYQKCYAICINWKYLFHIISPHSFCDETLRKAAPKERASPIQGFCFYETRITTKNECRLHHGLSTRRIKPLPGKSQRGLNSDKSEGRQPMPIFLPAQRCHLQAPDFPKQPNLGFLSGNSFAVTGSSSTSTRTTIVTRRPWG